MQISNAYEVLSDDQKRSIYDRYGEAGLKNGMGGMGGADMGGFNNPFDLFEQFFGASGGRAGAHQLKIVSLIATNNGLCGMIETTHEFLYNFKCTAGRHSDVLRGA